MSKRNVQKEITRNEIINKVRTGRELIDAVYLQNPDIGTIARHSSMSIFHFYRCFKNIYGISPYQYMLDKRLQKGRELLYVHDTPKTEIARICGFPNISAFSKAFKKKFGSSPRQFLEMQKGMDAVI